MLHFGKSGKCRLKPTQTATTSSISCRRHGPIWPKLKRNVMSCRHVATCQQHFQLTNEVVDVRKGRRRKGMEEEEDGGEDNDANGSSRIAVVVLPPPSSSSSSYPALLLFITCRVSNYGSIIHLIKLLSIFCCLLNH